VQGDSIGRTQLPDWRLRLRKAVFSANVQVKFFVTPQLEVSHHFIKGFACGQIRRVEQPGAFGAPPAMKTVFFDPYEFAFRCHL
jgi:hypothetical protein